MLPELLGTCAQVTGNLDAVQALLRAGASIMVKSGGCTAAEPCCGCWLLHRRVHRFVCQAAGMKHVTQLVYHQLRTLRRLPLCCLSHLPAVPYVPPADGEAYIGEDYLVPGSTPLHVAVIINNISIVHAILQASSAGLPPACAAMLVQQRQLQMQGAGRARP